MTLYAVVGLGTMIELPVPLSHRIIPATQTKQRPGITRDTPGYWVQHETGNTSPGANAEMHARFLEQGAEGKQLSYHFTTDDHEIIQLIPVSEVTWQAADGAGPGNMSGISCELCVNAGIDVAKSRHNAEALAGGIMKALHMGVERTKRHWDFNEGSRDRHHCPDTIMNDNYWPTFVANVGAIIAASPPIEPTTPVAYPITWDEGEIGPKSISNSTANALYGIDHAKRKVILRQSATPTGVKVGELAQGQEVTVVGTYLREYTNAAGKAMTQPWAFVSVAGVEGYPRVPMSALVYKWPTI